MSRYDVIIVGLGPVGATLAALLGEAGVRTLAIDRETRLYSLPRAAHFDQEAMRLFQQLGIAEAVLGHAQPAPHYEFRSGDGRLLMRFETPAGEGACGWRSSYMFYQPGLEQALRAKLAALGTVELRLGRRFASCRETADGIVVRLEGETGSEEVAASYLVGCDGASSAVRAAIGGGLFDYGFDEPWLVVDGRTRPGARVPEVNLQVCDPERPTTCVHMGPGRHRWEFMLRPGETADQALSDGFIAPLLAEWDCGPVEIERRALYRFHGLVAERWRVGRVLLAGDAAHQMPPFAGQGLCSGLRDAANLAWKLAAVARGEAGPDLLDSYQIEREPHVRAYIELAIFMGRTVCTLDTEAAAQRDAAMLAQEPARPAAFSPPPLWSAAIHASPGAGVLFPQPRAADRAGLDDVLGPGAWLIGGRAATSGELTRVGLDAPELAPFRGRIAAWLHAHAAEAVLVRPDRYVFGTGAPDALLAAWRACHAAPVAA